MIPLPAHGRDTAGDQSERAIELSKLEGGRPSFGVGRRVRERTQRSGASRVHAVLLVCLDVGSDRIGSDWRLDRLRDFAPPRMLYISSE